jgi:tripartite-type tricarboxylate transporter receptor subunit TctC
MPFPPDGNRRRLLVATAGLALASEGLAQAASFPSQPIRIIVPFPAGGPTDFAARLVAEELARSLGQPTIIDNRGGAAGMLGTTALVQSRGDGHTVGLLGNGLVTLTPYIRKDVGFDPLKDLVPLCKAIDVPILLTSHPSVPGQTFKEFAAYVKAHPGKLSYGSDGLGSLTHLTMEMFKHQLGLHIVHIPYRGTAQLTNDLLANTVQLSMSGIAGPLAHVKAGRLKALAVTSANRSPALPETPTLVESGLKDFEVTTWFGFFAPAGTPAPMAEKLNEHMSAALRQPGVVSRLRDAGLEAAPSTQAALDSSMRRYIRQWQAIIKSANIKLED